MQNPHQSRPKMSQVHQGIENSVEEGGLSLLHTNIGHDFATCVIINEYFCT